MTTRQAQPGQGDTGAQDRRHRSGRVESRGGVRPRQAPQAANGITRRGRRLSDGRQSCLGRHQVTGRERFEGEHQLNCWTGASAREFPRIGYAPSEYQTKPWPIEALIEGWFPLSSRGQCGFTVLSTADPSQNFSSSPAPGDLLCSPSAPERGRRSLPRVGEDAGCKNKSGIAGRAMIVSLDIPFHRRQFKLRVDSRQADR
jgi:hypothetical protein